MAIGVAISFLTLQADLSNTGEKYYPIMRLFFALDRGFRRSESIERSVA